MTEYYASLKKLLPRDDSRYYPTHGAPIDAASTGGTSPQAFVEALIAHRAAREAQILKCLDAARSEEHTSELQSLMRISYAVFCLKKKKKDLTQTVLTTTNIQKQ